MILSDRDIRARLTLGDLVIEPLANPELQLQPASVDLRLGREFLVYRPAQVTVLDPGDPEGIAASMERVEIAAERAFVLHPGEFALGTTVPLLGVAVALGVGAGATRGYVGGVRRLEGWLRPFAAGVLVLAGLNDTFIYWLL